MERTRIKILSTTRLAIGWLAEGYTQAKCDKCQLRFVWEGKPRVQDADCPVCSRELHRTTHECRYDSILCSRKLAQKPKKEMSPERREQLTAQLAKARAARTKEV